MKTQMKKRLLGWGFTLIELLVVISIVSLLSTIVLANISSVREKSRNTHRVASLNRLEKAIELYRDDNDGVPPGEDGVEYVNGNTEWIPGLVPSMGRCSASDY